MVKQKQSKNIILTRRDYKSSCATIKKIFQKKKERKKENMLGIDIRICTIRKRKKENDILEILKI